MTATKIIAGNTPASQPHSIAFLLTRMTGLIDEIESEIDKVYAVAAAGRAYAKAHNIAECCLFEVIGDLAEDRVLINGLRAAVTELTTTAQGAEVAHG